MESGRLIAGRYRLRERLGQGGMSVVWRADDDVLGREVAIKVLSPDLAGDPDVLRRQIRDEARAAAGLRHQGIVAVFDYGEVAEGGRVLSYVVMELVDGRSLADMLTGGRLPWRLAVLVGAQVAEALAAAHAAGIVHRDVKPANIMVTSSGVKLVDFGISAAVGELDGRDGQVIGTPAYLAPERIAGAPVRPATDVYALGLVLYLALGGRMPWQASTVTKQVRAHIYSTPAPLPPIHGLPQAVTRLVTRCLAKAPGERPSSLEVAEALGAVAGLPPASLMRKAAQPTIPVSRTPNRPTRRKALTLAAGVAGLLIAGGFWVTLAGTAGTAQAAAFVTPTPSSPAATTPGTASTTGPTAPPSTSSAVVTVQKRTGAGSRAGSKPPRAKGGPGPVHKPKPPKPPKKQGPKRPAR